MPKVKEFFARLDRECLAVTYAEVLLMPGYAECMPHEVQISGAFSRNIPLHIPLVSSPMDKVTEAPMAIEMAKLGGLGIIHKALPIDDQAFQVARVKHHMHGIIDRPITMRASQSVSDILAISKKRGYQFRSFLILSDENDTLVGILTGNDLDFCVDPSLPASAAMTTNVKTAKPGTSITEAFEIMQRDRHKLLPIVNADKQVVGLYTYKDVQRILYGDSRNIHTVDEKGQLRVGAAIGTGSDTMERVAKLVAEGVDVLVIDTAHGDSKPVLETLRRVKNGCKDIDVVAGNVSNPDSVSRLVEAGADGIKVGQGPGSICTTRQIAGTGCPQVTAVYKCAEVAREYGVPVCADGGVEYSGSITIALAIGASCVMLGKLLSGTQEAPGEVISFEGRAYKEYRGMGSLGAMVSNAAARERYSQGGAETSKLVPEGVEGRVPYAGSVQAVIHQLVGGLRAGMGYAGAADLHELTEKAELNRITPAGSAESHVHGVQVTKEPPNYHLPRI